MTKEDLAKRDYVVLIDKSGSMSTEDCVGGRSRWDHVQEQALNIARTAAKFDDDGIDVIVFNSAAKLHSNVTPDKVEQVFKEHTPSSTTATDVALKMALDGYFARKQAGTVKPLTVIVFTDGEPNDKKLVKNVIVEAANKIEADEELAILFFQVGKDEKARAFLKDLDDNLTSEGAKFDIVDTKNDEEMENMSAEQLLMEAVTD